MTPPRKLHESSAPRLVDTRKRLTVSRLHTCTTFAIRVKRVRGCGFMKVHPNIKCGFKRVHPCTKCLQNAFEKCSLFHICPFRQNVTPPPIHRALEPVAHIFAKSMENSHMIILVQMWTSIFFVRALAALYAPGGLRATHTLRRVPNFMNSAYQYKSRPRQRR